MTLPVPMVKNSEVQLLPGTIQTLYQDQKTSPLYNQPRLQIIHLKKLNAANPNNTAQVNDPANDRYRVILSDGVAYMQAMLGISCNELAANELLKANTLISLKKFTSSLVKDRRVLIILDIDVASLAQCDAKIGSPANIEDILGIKISGAQPAGTPAPSSAGQPAPMAKANDSASFSSSANPYATLRTPNPYDVGQADPGRSQAKPKSSFDSISSLSPYQTTWTIQVRCIAKTDIKTWTNARGEGKLFSATLLDDSGEIRMTGFNDACTIFYPILEVGKIFRLSKASIKLARKQFSSVANDYEIHLEKDSIVLPVSEKELGGQALPMLKFSFEKIQDLMSFQKDESVDILGVVKEIGELSQITTKSTQRQLSKRDLVLADASCCMVRVTLWGKQAEDASTSEWQSNPILAIKAAKVSDYSGRTLSISNASLIQLNPDIPESHELRGWFDTIGQSTSFHNLSSGSAISGAGGGLDEMGARTSSRLEDRCMINDIKTEGLGNGDKADYIDLVATISFIKSDGAISYPACSGTNESGGPCQKKVTEIGPNLYRCEKCARNYDAPLHRYIFSLHVSDFSGQTWLNAFNEAGLAIFGEKSAQDLIEVKDADLTAYQKIIKEATFKQYLFRVRIKNEIYQGENKSRASILSLTRVDYVSETKMMLQWLTAVTSSF